MFVEQALASSGSAKHIKWGEGGLVQLLILANKVGMGCSHPPFLADIIFDQPFMLRSLLGVLVEKLIYIAMGHNKFRFKDSYMKFI